MKGESVILGVNQTNALQNRETHTDVVFGDQHSDDQVSICLES